MTATEARSPEQSIFDELDRPYVLNGPDIDRYRKDGFIKLKQVLSPRALAFFGEEITRVVRQTPSAGIFPQSHLSLLDAKGLALIEKMSAREKASGDSTYARAFTQRPNVWLLSPIVERLVRSRRLAKLAADLIGVPGVRLYHDQALFKEPNGGHTPWHCDQYYWPLSSAQTTTIWIPLQAVPEQMGPLAFARGSHKLEGSDGRELAISDESEETIGKLMEAFEVDASPFDLGEVSFHSGWMFHRAGANVSDRVRAAFTIIYMDRDMRVVEPHHPQRRFDHALWLPGTQPGDAAATPINPVLYES